MDMTSQKLVDESSDHSIEAPSLQKQSIDLGALSASSLASILESPEPMIFKSKNKVSVSPAPRKRDSTNVSQRILDHAITVKSCPERIVTTEQKIKLKQALGMSFDPKT
jgi:hypothetical protein